jgi:polysaccharide export outer membrane protein
MKKFFLLAFSLFLTVICANADVYTVNPGDVLEVSVWNEEALQKEVRILPDGSVSFPLAGNLLVAGQSVTQIQAVLTEKLSAYIADPVVNVSVKATEGNTIYVLGQVKQPGQFVLGQPMDVLQALSLAGGLTAFAKANDIKVIRHIGDKSEAMEFEYNKVADGDKLENNYRLQSGDVVIVP